MGRSVGMKIGCNVGVKMGRRSKCGSVDGA